MLMIIASSVYDKSIPSDWAILLADVGLTGELSVSLLWKAASRSWTAWASSRFSFPQAACGSWHLENIRVVEAKFLSQLLNHVFGKKEMDKEYSFLSTI